MGVSWEWALPVRRALLKYMCVCVCVCVCMRDREVGVGQRGEMEWEENKRMKEWHPPAGLSWGCKVSFLGRFSFPVPFSAVHRDSPVL